MRLTLKRGIQWVFALVLLHVVVYYWTSHKTSKSLRKKPHRYLASPYGEEGTCSFNKCPSVREDMLNVHLIPHSHIDVGWLKTVDQYYTGEKGKGKCKEDPIGVYLDTNGTRLILIPRSIPDFIYFNPKLECVKCTFNSTIAELLKNPKRRFILVEMIYFSRYWSEVSYEQKEIIRKLIKERRLEIVNGGWVISDAGVAMYNDIIDQHTLGNNFIRNTFGPCAYTKTAWHIDQFGHSREHASILAQMGFDSLFVGRIDFRDHERRKLTKNLEFLWETSPDNYGKKGTLFTQATFDGYYAPPRFVLDDVNFNMFSSPRNGNVMSFLRVIQERANAFQTNHLLVPMGSDFGYSNATTWYNNMDRLIEVVHKEQPLSNVKLNFIYSTPSCYTYYINKANATFEIKSDDFHPYGISPGVYWTGYFTTRGGFKMHIKRAGQILQSCKQLSVLLHLDGTYKKVYKLKNAMAIMQHHDAITGTQKRHVLNDYNLILSEGISQCEAVISMALQRLWSSEEKLVTMPSSFCHDLNISSCDISEGKEQFLMTVYNPLSWVVDKWIRIPVSLFKLTITSPKYEPVPFQLVSIAQSILTIPERTTGAEVEAVFKARLPPMSTSGFLVKPERGKVRPLIEAVPKDVNITIENEHISLVFDGKSGLLMEMINKDSQIQTSLSQAFFYYEGMQGGGRSSGAYVFIPAFAKPKRIASDKAVKLKITKGHLVQEIHQTFSSWVTQVIRLYAGAKYAEIQWTVGPIPTEDGIGKEVISLFSSDIKNKGIFYTDSSGREMMERIRDYRETWKHEAFDKVSGNYYPIASKIYIKDERRNVQLTLLPDRPQGGSSINDGTLELMVHRKLLFDDGLGVGEPLDDKGDDRKGIIFTGKHFVVMDTIKNSIETSRYLSLQLHFDPPILFSKIKDDYTKPSYLQKNTFLSEPLPRNIQVLSLDYISNNETDLYLLRLEHIFEVNEHHELSRATSVSLQKLFRTFEIVSVEETTLGANFHPTELKKMRWMAEKGPTSTDIGSNDISATMAAPFTITLQPMEIRTFRIQVER